MREYEVVYRDRIFADSPEEVKQAIAQAVMNNPELVVEYGTAQKIFEDERSA